MISASPMLHKLSTGPKIALEGLYFAYDASHVFSDFALTARSPLIVLEGPSGCGKTTLLKLLGGLLSPARASVFCRPEPTRIILQEDALFPWLTVKGNMAAVPGWNGIHRCPAAVRPLIPLVEPLMDQHAYRLSFGQRRLVELFRVLSFPAPLMCLDEPLNHLDVVKRGAVAGVIEELAKEGTCFVVSSHYREDFQNWDADVFKFNGTLPVGRLERL